MKKIILLSSALLSAVFLIGAGCEQQPTGLVLPSTTTPVTQPPTNQPTSNTPTPIVDENGASTIYKNQETGFEFTYPKEWQTQSRKIMSDLGEKVFVGFTSGFSVSVFDTSVYSIDDLKAAPPGGIDPDSVKEALITVDGNSAIETSYVSVGDSDFGSKNIKKVSIFKNSLIYIIEGSVDDCSIVLPTFKFIK